MAITPCRRALFFGCFVVAMLAMARTGLAMQFRGSEDANAAALDSVDAAQAPDAADDDASPPSLENAAAVGSEAVVNDVDEPDNDVDDEITDSDSPAGGEVDSNTDGGASFVQQASNADAADSNEGDSLDAEAEPAKNYASADEDADAGEPLDEDSSKVEQAGGVEDEDSSAAAMGGDAVDKNIQPHYD